MQSVVVEGVSWSYIPCWTSTLHECKKFPTIKVTAVRDLGGGGSSPATEGYEAEKNLGTFCVVTPGFKLKLKAIVFWFL